jgi:hypothetical protein
MTAATKKRTLPAAVNVQTDTRSQPTNVLTQSELRAWWPFTRLDPSRIPKPVYEECLF